MKYQNKSVLSDKISQYKALIADIDGTLVPNRRDGMPSQKVKEAITLASKHIHVGIATSRPISELHDIIKDLDLSGPSIIDAGAQIIDFPSKKILIQKPMNFDDYYEVCALLKKEKLVMFLVNDNGIDVEFSKSYVPKKVFNLFIKRFSAKEADRIMNKLSHIPTIAIRKISLWEGKFGLEITHAKATKQYAIFEIAKILGIETNEIIGIGDGDNDFPLLMACGLKVAMGNALPGIKAIADYVAPSVDEDGVADVINKFVLN